MLRDAPRVRRSPTPVLRADSRADFGGTPVAPEIPAASPTTLEAIAVENGREGCVRETFGALVALYQAQNASDPNVRRALTRIARDELRHAALAWRVKRWADRHLDSRGRDQVRSEIRRAAGELLAELGTNAPASIAHRVGIPPGAMQKTMAAALAAELWVDRSVREHEI